MAHEVAENVGAATEQTEKVLQGAINRTAPEAMQQIQDLFRMFDTGGDGKIGRDELETVLITLDPRWTPERRGRLFKVVDLDGNGVIDYKEFMAWAYGSIVEPVNEGAGAEAAEIIQDVAAESPAPVEAPESAAPVPPPELLAEAPEKPSEENPAAAAEAPPEEDVAAAAEAAELRKEALDCLKSAAASGMLDKLWSERVEPVDEGAAEEAAEDAADPAPAPVPAGHRRLALQSHLGAGIRMSSTPGDINAGVRLGLGMAGEALEVEAKDGHITITTDVGTYQGEYHESKDLMCPTWACTVLFANYTAGAAIIGYPNSAGQENQEMSFEADGVISVVAAPNLVWGVSPEGYVVLVPRGAPEQLVFAP